MLPALSLSLQEVPEFTGRASRVLSAEPPGHVVGETSYCLGLSALAGPHKGDHVTERKGQRGKRLASARDAVPPLGDTGQTP